jgi:hypothetical protein
LAPPARASAGGSDEKKKDERKAPDAEGHGAGVEGHPEKNPLPDIIDLMRKVEERLAEADTGAWTQSEQEKIAKALQGQSDAIDALQKLIKAVEDQARQQQGSGGGGQQDRQRNGQRRQDQRPQGSERKDEERRQPASPEQQPGQQDRNRQRTEEQRKRAEESAKEKDPKLDPARGGGNPGERWGDLPAKQAREVIDAKQRPMPPAWRKALEEYYRRLSETRR